MYTGRRSKRWKEREGIMCEREREREREREKEEGERATEERKKESGVGHSTAQQPTRTAKVAGTIIHSLLTHSLVVGREVK